MTEGKTFLDTNVILYAFDTDSPLKHAMARGIVEELWKNGNGVVSTQVMQEFLVNVTGKISRPLHRDVAKDIVADFLKWKVVVNDGRSILSAIDIQGKCGYSFWDALIIQSALEAGAKWLLSEDLKDGQRIGDVTIRNPFARGEKRPAKDPSAS